ncbi:Tar ligand binding domain-containing protein, partial [Escherichia coli]|uniref:Tar ligand binding domain-containing protein n=1 Tax=Escherichia coli TaxID=562 RepID=UPI0020259119
MINRIRVVTLLVMVLGVFALLQLISGSLFFSSLHHSQKSFVVSNQLREQQGELTSTWDLMLQTRINLSRSAVRMMMDSSNQQSNAKVELLDSARKTLAQAATHYKKFKSMAPLPEMVATSRNIDEKYKNYYTALMNPLMILVKIIKLRWIHILSYDQMVSRKINNQTTRCANSIFYTTLFTNSAP